MFPSCAFLRSFFVLFSIFLVFVREKIAFRGCTSSVSPGVQGTWLRVVCGKSFVSFARFCVIIFSALICFDFRVEFYILHFRRGILGLFSLCSDTYPGAKNRNILRYRIRLFKKVKKPRGNYADSITKGYRSKCCMKNDNLSIQFI